MEGACNRTVFELCLETCLIPLLEKGQRIVIDNATFHHGGRIAALIVALFTCSLILLTLIALRSVGLGSKVAFANAYVTLVICGMLWSLFFALLRPNLSGYGYSCRYFQLSLYFSVAIICKSICFCQIKRITFWVNDPLSHLFQRD